MFHTPDLTGLSFGRLTVVTRGERRQVGRRPRHTAETWLCRCTCGIERTVLAQSLRRGLTRSCGCLKREVAAEHGRLQFTRHGGRYTPEWRCWRGIKQRCSQPKQQNYYKYGGRGITVCRRWLESFENFISDMGPKPSPLHSIDRINNDGNYEPGNCRWALPQEQRRNRRAARRWMVEGTRHSQRQRHRRLVLRTARALLGAL